MHYARMTTFPTQPLRGLGAISATSVQERAAFLQQASNDFLAAAQRLVSDVKASAAKVRKNASIIDLGRTKEVCDRVEANVEMGIANLVRTDERGEPLFMRKPQDAVRLLQQVKSDAEQMLDDHLRLMISTGMVALFGDFGLEALKALIVQAITGLIGIVDAIITTSAEGIGQGLIASATRYPVATAAVGAAVAALIWYKFIR